MMIRIGLLILWRDYQRRYENHKPILMKDLEQLDEVKRRKLIELSDLTEQIDTTYNNFLDIRGNQTVLQRDESIIPAIKEIMEKFPSKTCSLMFWCGLGIPKRKYSTQFAILQTFKPVPRVETIRLNLRRESSCRSRLVERTVT